MIAANRFQFRIDIPYKNIGTVLKWIVLLDLLFLSGTWLHHNKLIFQHSYTLNLLLMQFNLGKENVAAAWYSSMLLLLV